ncbi:MAG: uroporphyrinogen decarboxylase family protein [Clostridia bacterium]
MDNRERVLKLLQGGIPDRVPWFGDLDYWHSAESKKGRLPEKYKGDGYFQLNRDYATGFYLQGFYPFSQTSKGVEIRETREGTRRIRTMQTPFGELHEIQQYLETSSSWGYVKHFVEEETHLKAFGFYVDSLEFTPCYEEAERRYGIIGDNGVVLCYAPRSPFMEMVTTYAGIENLTYLLMDAKDETEDILKRMEEKFDTAARLTLNSPAECIMIPENLSSEAVGKTYYNSYMKGYEQKWVEAIREKGKFSFIHMDGTLKGLIGEVADTGFHVIEAVTPEPSGDMPMEDIAALDTGDSILWGGLPGIVFTPAVSEVEFISHVQYVLGIMRKEPRFVLGVADQVPPDGLIERVGLVAGLCDEYGAY